MTDDIAIDTSSLLTILGVIAAVWAIIPANNRLRFRLSVIWFDWLIVIAVFLVAMLLKIFTAGLLLICLHNASAESLTGRVVAVADGDTITVLDVQQPERRSS